MTILWSVALFLLGAMIGGMVAWFVPRFQTYDVKVLSGVVSVILGGLGSSAIVYWLGVDKAAAAWYFIGLPIGVILTAFVNRIWPSVERQL